MTVTQLTIFDQQPELVYGDITPEDVARDGIEAYGECTKYDPEVMFPETRGKEVVAESKAICAACPLAVLEACLKGAFERGEEHGTWGGMTEWERRTYIATRRMRDYRDRQKNTAAIASAA